MDKTKSRRELIIGAVPLTINTTINSFLGETFSPREFPVLGAWAMPCTIRNLPTQGEIK